MSIFLIAAGVYYGVGIAGLASFCASRVKYHNLTGKK